MNVCEFVWHHIILLTRSTAMCIVVACRVGEFRCSDGSCIPDYLVCDGQRHCWDGSDEWGCPSELLNISITPYCLVTVGDDSCYYWSPNSNCILYVLLNRNVFVDSQMDYFGNHSSNSPFHFLLFLISF